MPSRPASTLHVGGACARNAVDLDAAALRALGARHQVPDVGAVAPGRDGVAVRLAALAEVARPSADARFVHVESADGGFTANIPLERALAHGLVLYARDGAPLPASHGGPFRLLVVDADAEPDAGEDCSLNVKFLGRVTFVGAPGSHTARCAD
jgi:DMSO/TMAO reductase YedYZ molybdopterin-dependent catalytic subunit